MHPALLWSPPSCSSATCPGAGQMWVPTAPSLCYLPRSSPRRIPRAAGLQPRHGPSVLPMVPGAEASPAGSASPAARLPAPRSARPWLPAPRSLDFAFGKTAELFPKLPGTGRGRGGARAGIAVRGREAGTGALPRCCCPGTALLGDGSGADTNPAAERGQILPGAQQGTRSSPARTPGRCWAGLGAPLPRLLLCFRDNPEARGWGDGPSTAGRTEFGPPLSSQDPTQP